MDNKTEDDIKAERIYERGIIFTRGGERNYQEIVNSLNSLSNTNKYIKNGNIIYKGRENCVIRNGEIRIDEKIRKISISSDLKLSENAPRLLKNIVELLMI